MVKKIQQTKKKCEDPILYRCVVSTGLAAPKMLTVRGLTFVTSFAYFTSKDKERLSFFDFTALASCYLNKVISKSESYY
jgi:hypothetical protein